MPRICEAWTGGQTHSVKRSIEACAKQELAARERRTHAALAIIAVLVGAAFVAMTGCSFKSDVHKSALDLREALEVDHAVTAPVSTLTESEVAAVNSLRADELTLIDAILKATEEK